MSLYGNPAYLLEQLGEAYTLRRATKAAGANSWTAGTETITYYAQRALRREAKPNDAGGLVRDGQSRFTMSPSYTAPQQGDQIAYGTISSDTGVEWLEIVHVDTVRVEGQVAKYFAWVRN